MSKRHRSRPDALKLRADLFAALGDSTRLAVLGKLMGGEPHSIAHLTAGTGLTRQAVSKHLRVLEGAGVVRSARAGREVLFVLEPQPIADARDYLDQVSRAWDEALLRLKSHLEG